MPPLRRPNQCPPPPHWARQNISFRLRPANALPSVVIDAATSAREGFFKSTRDQSAPRPCWKRRGRAGLSHSSLSGAEARRRRKGTRVGVRRRGRREERQARGSMRPGTLPLGSDRPPKQGRAPLTARIMTLPR